MQTEIAKLVREQEAAKILDVSVKTLQQWRCRGGGPAFKKLGGRAVRYTLHDLQSFIENATDAK